MLLEVPNRGHARILSLVDGGDQNLAEDAGDAWLLRSGFTVVGLGWQWDADGHDALRLNAPIAKENGKTIAGFLRGDLMPSTAMPEIPLGHLIMGSIGGAEYAVADPEDPSQHPHGARFARGRAHGYSPRGVAICAHRRWKTHP